MIGASDLGTCIRENGEFDELAGITPRAVSELFRLLSERQGKNATQNNTKQHNTTQHNTTHVTSEFIFPPTRLELTFIKPVLTHLLITHY